MFDFPAPATINETATAPNGAVFVWDGMKWTTSANAAAIAAAITASTVNVLDHGAAGDGTTDDTAAIQAVLNAYAGKATVFVPDTGHSFGVSTLALPTGTDLLIHGKVLCIIESTGNVVDFSNSSNVTIRGHGIIDGNNVAFAAWPYVMANLGGNNATNVRISGITSQNAIFFALSVTASSYVYVDSVRLLNSINSSGFGWSHHCWISKSYINTGSDSVWSFYGGCSYCGISECDVSGARISGIGVYADGTGPPTGAPAQNIVIANNVVYNNGEDGINVASVGDFGPGPTFIHTGIVITGNRCFANALANGQSAEVHVSSVNGVIVSGNNLSGSGAGTVPAWGVWVGLSASYVSITGNTIYNEGQGGTAGVGIYLQIPTYVLIQGNYIYDSQATHTMLYGIDGTAGANTAIIGNHFGPLGGGEEAIHAILASDTVVANSMYNVWIIGTGTAQGTGMGMDAAEGYSASFQYRSGSTMRWFVGTDGATESGGNVGSNYNITSCTDGGTPLATPLSISRATNRVTLAVAPTITTLPTNAANDAAAASAGVPVGGVYRSGSQLMVRVA